MKTAVLLSLVASSTLCLATGAAEADPVTLVGPVAQLNTSIDNAHGNTFFTVADATKVPGCLESNGLTMALIPDNERGKQLFAMVIAASLSGKTLHLTVDATLATNGYCWVQNLWM
jgi:hypothetical protein